MNICLFAAIVCLEVADVTNGNVIYVTDNTAPFELGTRTIYSCNSGFAITGVTNRICQANSSNPIGRWTESSPVCVGKELSDNSRHYRN